MSWSLRLTSLMRINERHEKVERLTNPPRRHMSVSHCGNLLLLASDELLQIVIKTKKQQKKTFLALEIKNKY